MFIICFIDEMVNKRQKALAEGTRHNLEYERKMVSKKKNAITLKVKCKIKHFYGF